MKTNDGLRLLARTFDGMAAAFQGGRPVPAVDVEHAVRAARRLLPPLAPADQKELEKAERTLLQPAVGKTPRENSDHLRAAQHMAKALVHARPAPASLDAEAAATITQLDQRYAALAQT